jgi:hypothetical protein
MIDTEIEVFRADTRASRGITTERLASVAAFDCETHPIGCVIGHPKSDSPAEGRITGFRLDGNKLFASLKGVTQKVVDGIKNGSILNRSMAFFGEDDDANPTPGKLAPRHLGFLGGAAPGIPGMTSLSKALAFAADDEAGDNLLIEGDPAPAWIEQPAGTSVIFTAKEPEMSIVDPNAPVEKSPAELAFEARQDEFAKRVRMQFEASNGSAIDALVREGKVLPVEAEGLKLAFNAFDPEAEDLTFGAGDKQTKASAVSHILTFMAGVPKRVPVDTRLSPNKEFTAGDEKPKFNTPAEFNAAAEKLAKEQNLSFEAAAEQLAE